MGTSSKLLGSLALWWCLAPMGISSKFELIQFCLMLIISQLFFKFELILYSHFTVISKCCLLAGSSIIFNYFPYVYYCLIRKKYYESQFENLLIYQYLSISKAILTSLASQHNHKVFSTLLLVYADQTAASSCCLTCLTSQIPFLPHQSVGIYPVQLTIVRLLLPNRYFQPCEIVLAADYGTADRMLHHFFGEDGQVPDCGVGLLGV